jgi:hypothetical protein
MERKGTMSLTSASSRWPALLFCAAILTGCGRPGAVQAPTDSKLGPDGVDVAAVQQAFKGADASLKFSLDDHLRMIGAGAYGDAAQGLRKLAANPLTSPEQKKALEDLLQALSQLPAVAANH